MDELSPALKSRFAQVALQRTRMLAPVAAVAMMIGLLMSERTGIAINLRIIELNVVTISITSVLAVALLLRRVPERWGHAAGAVVWWSAISTSLVSFAIMHDPKLFILIVLQMTTGIVMVSTPWLGGSYLAFDLMAFPLALDRGGSDGLFGMMTIIIAQAVALVIHRVKLHSFVVAETHRVEAERQLAELQRSEQARADLTEQLVHVQRLEAVGTLAAGLAHDMNNVLAAIMGLADNLAETVTDPQQREDARDILHEAERGAELTRGLLTFSRRGQYRNQVLRIGEIVDEVVGLLNRTLPKTVQLERQLVDCDACVEGDPTQFSQALVNLGINASDAMSGKGRLILRGETVDVAVGSSLALAPGRYALLRVIDTGSGMDEATRTRAFEPFFTTKPMGKGTGLGLALVWGVVHKSRGTVTVDSELGKGSTFSIYLPLTTKQLATPANESGPILRQPQRGTVLVVDDEPAVRSSTTRMLERLGLRTLAAGNGLEGLQLFDAHASEIALVVLDMGMPGMGGAEVFRALRERGNVKVLIATGYAMEEDVQRLVSTGARVLEKPFKLQALEIEVERALRRKQTQN